MELTAGMITAGIVGVVLGAMVTYLWRFSEAKQQGAPETTPVPVVPAGADAVLSVLSSSAVLIDPDDVVVKASAPAFAMGLVHEDRLVPEELMDLVRQVRRNGQVRDADITISARRGSTTNIHARVAPLSSRLIVILVTDRTHEHRVESIRRDFVANVSHELKTPIGALNLLAEAVAEAKDDPDAVVRFSARMHLESERLTRLVQQIIDLSRLQNDVLSDEATTLKVDELVGEAIEQSATEIERKNVSIVTSVQSDAMVHGDQSQLQAAVSNLVENAVTYSPERSRVAVSAERHGDDIRITVSDNGIGIPENELDRIFERFYRVDPARSRATGGTGLGLSIVKHVAASNGGSVEVWSEPGLGSSFTLILPARVDDPEEEHA